VLILVILLSLTIIYPDQTLLAKQSGVTWQLVVVSSEPACSGYHYTMVQKYNEITQKYLDLYKINHNNYQPECFTERDFTEEYEKPYDLDLIILVFDKDKGITDLHTHNTGGIYMHQGNDLSTNHTVIICDCPNFKYSDPVWILSHELSHFVLNYLGFDLKVVEEEIHGRDYKFDSCVEGVYDDLCSTIKTRVATSGAYWTVMIPYEPAIGKEPQFHSVDKVAIDSSYQKNMILEITKWWIDKEISDENYINSLKILSGKTDDGIIPTGVFQSSSLLILAEPQNNLKEKQPHSEISNELTKKILNLDSSISVNQTTFSSEDEKILLEWLEEKAVSWESNKIDDNQFVTQLENILDSSKVNLYQNYLDSLSVEELILKGIEFEKAGKYRNALSFYDKAIIESSNSNEIEIKALIGKGSNLNSLGQYEDSLQYFDMALEIEPNNIDVLKKKAFTLAQLGQIEDAKEYFEMVKQIKME
jgi:tetratricopeptide (TPR) repeat protein